MVFRTDGFSAVLLAVVGGAAIASPALAEVPWAWANLRSSTHQVSLVSVGGSARSATVDDCFCPGETLNTSASAKAEVLFNDGSLTRVGGQASLRFWPDTRSLRLNRGTVAVFVPPDQGRTTIETPNATVGLNSTGIVVRYVPSRQLTLVMALADAPTPVLVTAAETEQELALYGGQMAFVGGGSWQVVEFDLLEFYQTSDLMAGLQLDNPSYRPAPNDPLAALRPDLLQALGQQAPFDAENAILDPVLINDFAAGASIQGAEDALVTVPPTPVEELRRFNDTPPGVVNPLPEMLDTASPPAEVPLTVEVPVEDPSTGGSTAMPASVGDPLSPPP
ncbi:FecR domain-containing protein [Leptolyngbya sp. CCNP1308]|uniref:FecR domain-containing protein n=1 Tax=Leptolyngbya sp. CCNP1308 TaxID=3110255 RepID=UPI002B1F441F|nr:FecR domain-containing protein [Leptolyngbya sp. CCNP1308]MEA5448477.1 FecR domain-containing protein [Leptolyngbya sp. CCNP1308]